VDSYDAFRALAQDRFPLPSADDFGNGSFGRWIVDANDLPAYSHAPADTSQDHWHLLGNDRVTATAHSIGYVQVYDWTRGGKVVNRWEPARGHYGGGFKYVQIGETSFHTFAEGLPPGAELSVVFGMGYSEKTTRCAGLTIRERIEVPPGDDPVLLSTTVIENGGGETVNASVTEFWGVNMHQLFPAPILTHGLDRFWEWFRRFLNRRFTVEGSWCAPDQVLGVDYRPRHPRRAPAREKPALVDHYPKRTFLAALDPLPKDFSAYATDGTLFFQGGRHRPAGLAGTGDGRLLAGQHASRARAILAIRREVVVPPHGQATLRYLYGYADPEQIPGLAAKYRLLQESKPRAVLDLRTPEAPWLSRELRWHSYYLQAASIYQEYYGTHFVDQGSAYAYLHGGSGAPRDIALFTLPLTYLRPDLAKESLRFLMRTQDHGSGALPYIYLGHGKASGAGIHGRSSDLDLFLLWALAEYVGATFDTAFLEEELPFYPLAAGRSETVLGHARAAFDHLTRRVGVGKHGLLRCGTGDWNDVLLSYSRVPSLTKRRGESSLNAGLAALALPALADAVEFRDADFAERLRRFAAGQAKALQKLWTEHWVGRGYLGYGDAMLGRDRIFLDTQAFGVLAGVWDDSQRQTIFDSIQRLCSEPQSVGARCLWPPMRGPLLERGSDTNGGTWAAVDAWTAWAWSLVCPEAAWKFYLSTTLAARAEAYPEVWYGIWSGPDAYNAHYHARPGETYNVNATPTTKFPVMNTNRHSGPLFDAIKLAGIGPRAGELVIDPRFPFDTFSLELPLVGVMYLPGQCCGYYAPVVSGHFRFAVRLPRGLSRERIRFSLNAAPARFSVDEQGMLHFERAGCAGERLVWEIGLKKQEADSDL
jgi:hypothetical protein